MSVMTIPEAWYVQDRTLTVEDMESMPDDEFRYELDDGVLIVSPAPNSSRLADLLPQWVRISRGRTVRSQCGHGVFRRRPSRFGSAGQDCPVMRHAVTLARWTGNDHHPVTAGDLGEEWRHEITLEKTLARDPGQDYPVCVAFRGDSPVEYWSEDDPEEPEPFALADVNRKLAGLGRGPE